MRCSTVEQGRKCAAAGEVASMNGARVCCLPPKFKQVQYRGRASYRVSEGFSATGDTVRASGTNGRHLMTRGTRFSRFSTPRRDGRVLQSHLYHNSMPPARTHTTSSAASGGSGAPARCAAACDTLAALQVDFNGAQTRAAAISNLGGRRGAGWRR
jgi:hypothetical protein